MGKEKLKYTNQDIDLIDASIKTGRWLYNALLSTMVGLDCIVHLFNLIDKNEIQKENIFLYSPNNESMEIRNWNDLNYKSIRTIFFESNNDVKDLTPIVKRKIKSNFDRADQKQIRKAINKRKFKISYLFQTYPLKWEVVHSIFEVLENEISEFNRLNQIDKNYQNYQIRKILIEKERLSNEPFKYFKRRFFKLSQEVNRYKQLTENLSNQLGQIELPFLNSYSYIYQNEAELISVKNQSINDTISTTFFNNKNSFDTIFCLNIKLKLLEFAYLNKKSNLKISPEILNNITKVFNFIINYISIHAKEPSLEEIHKYLTINDTEYFIYKDILHSPDQYEFIDSKNLENNISTLKKHRSNASNKNSKKTKSLKKIKSDDLIKKLSKFNSLAPKNSQNKIRIAYLKKNILYKQSKKINRNPYIAEIAKMNANGRCQLCEKLAPFLDTDGSPYLETHHIKWLSKGGEDTLNNVVALCPNCHRKVHILNSKADYELLKLKANKMYEKFNTEDKLIKIS